MSSVQEIEAMKDLVLFEHNMRCYKLSRQEITDAYNTFWSLDGDRLNLLILEDIKLLLNEIHYREGRKYRSGEIVLNDKSDLSPVYLFYPNRKEHANKAYEMSKLYIQFLHEIGFTVTAQGDGGGVSKYTVSWK